MEVSTYLAELGSLEPRLHSAGWQNTPCHPVFPAFVIKDISWAKLPQPQETRAIHHVSVVICREHRTQGETREVVTGQEAFRRQIAIGVEVRFRRILRPILQKFDLPLRFHLFAFGVLLFVTVGAGIVNRLPCLVSLQHCWPMALS